MSVESAGTFQPHPSPPPDPPDHTPGRAIVLFMILTTAAVFVILFVVLYVRWARAEEPNAMVIVSATPAFDNAEIIVEGVALASPYKVKVGDRFGRTIPFYLDRGSYTLRIARDGDTLFASEVSLQSNQVLRLDLKRVEHLMPPPATASASPPPPG